MPTMAKWLATGEVDLYFDSPYPAMIVGDQSKAQPILRRWKNGISEYHTVIFVRQASGLKQLSDLQGHKIAFEDNFSTSGYMLPLAYLIRTNLKVLKEGDLPSEDGAKDKVLYRFSGNDENSIQWVLRGRVDAAAVGSYKFAEIPAAVRNQLKILTKTEVLPRHLVLASPTLDERTQGAIKTVLMAMDETEEGRAILQQFEQTAQFDGFPEGAEAALARMRDLYDLVKNK
jgi:phosphonate transport system substrate-binding protein